VPNHAEETITRVVGKRTQAPDGEEPPTL